MAENENRNELNQTNESNPSIVINNVNNNNVGGQGGFDTSVIAIIVEYIRQSGLNTQAIKDLLASLDKLATLDDIKGLNDKQTKSIRTSIYNARNAIINRIETLFNSVDFVNNKDEITKLLNIVSALDAKIETSFGELADEVKTLNGKQTKSLRTTIYNARDRILERIDGLNPSAEVSKLREEVAGFVAMIDGRLKDSTAAENATAEVLRTLVSTVSSLEKKVDELVKNGTTPSVTNNTTNVTNNTTNTTETNVNNTENNIDNSTETNVTINNNSNNTTSNTNNTTNNTNNTTNNAANGTAGTTTTTNPVSPVAKPKLKKLRFVQKSLQQTKILAEPKQPWYKRVATFAIKHPVLSVVAGAGIGLGLFGVTCGVAAVAGGTGFLTAVNMMLPSIPGFAGLGAVGAGAISVTSNTLPKGKWGLVAKANRQFNKVKKIDRSKQWVASFEKQQEAAKEASREKHRNSKGLVRKLKVHRKLSKVHKLAERTARKVGRLYSRRLEKATTGVLKTKSKLNVKEIKSGRTQAIAGYLYKKRKAENKFAQGKIDAEELEERLADYEEDVADLDGGSEGLNEVGNQYTFDAEALDAIERADANGNNAAFQAVKKDILTRNSRETRSIETRVVLDPEYLESVIEDMKKKGETENLAKYEEELARINAQAEEARRLAQAEGVADFNPFADMSDEEVAQWEADNGLDK